MKSAARPRRKRTYQSVVDGVGASFPQFDERAAQKSRSASKNRTIHFNLDIWMLLIVFILIIFGLLMVYSASYDYSSNWYDDPNMIFNRQLIWLALGLVGMTAMIFMDYHVLGKLAVPVIAITVVLLFAVLIVSEVVNGATRTLYRGSVQPSELAKLVTVIYLSIWFNARRDQLSNVGFGLIPLGIILGILGGLIAIQPDLSAALTILFLGGLMFFLAGGELKQIGLLIVLALVMGWLIVQFHPQGSKRISAYLMGLEDPTAGSYQVVRSLEAFSNGGWFGAGIGKATTKVTGLPVPPTDSIFAVVGEETGVFGSALLVGLYGLLLWRGLKIARHAPDEMGALLAAGLIVWISLEAFINMSVSVSLLPVTGNPLPFISAGGSNLVATLTAVGIILGISRVSVRKNEDKGNPFDAVIDLRRWNRRRSQSSARRSASAGK